MPIKSFHDLDVYQLSYQAAIRVIKELLPMLPKNERWDLMDQMRRASKAVPALIAEGYAKKHQRKNFRKYLDDALGECNEMIVHLSFCKELYATTEGLPLCELLIDQYDKAGRQLYRLAQHWQFFTRDDDTELRTSHVDTHLAHHNRTSDAQVG